MSLAILLALQDDPQLDELTSGSPRNGKAQQAYLGQRRESLRSNCDDVSIRALRFNECAGSAGNSREIHNRLNIKHPKDGRHDFWRQTIEGAERRDAIGPNPARRGCSIDIGHLDHCPDEVAGTMG
ncbi:hypothetical protein MAJ_08986, partial [Metarhizium majus ARSEF 297]